MAERTEKMSIDSDEWYPVYSVRAEEKYGYPIEIPVDALQRWEACTDSSAGPIMPIRRWPRSDKCSNANRTALALSIPTSATALAVPKIVTIGLPKRWAAWKYLSLATGRINPSMWAMNDRSWS